MQLNKISPGFRAFKAVEGPNALYPGTTVLVWIKLGKVQRLHDGLKIVPRSESDKSIGMDESGLLQKAESIEY